MERSKKISRNLSILLSLFFLGVLLSCGGEDDKVDTVEAIEETNSADAITEEEAVEETVDELIEEEVGYTEESSEEEGEEASEEFPEDVAEDDPLLDIEFDESVIDELPETAAGAPDVPDYEVKLAVDDSIAVGSTGTLIVWIGAETAEFEVSSGMVSDKRNIPSDAGDYAEITPYGPGFEVSPIQQKCVKIHPSGSEVKFSIKPLEAGNMVVSANIKLYTNSDCSGSPVPKTAADLKVTVYVDKVKEREKKKEEFENVFWEKLKDFWGALLALFFGLILFLLRKKLKAWFGFEENN